MKYIFLSSNIFFLVVIFITYPQITRSDLPVHCLVSDVEGEWILRINKETFEAQPNDEKTTCNHGLPDKIDITEGDKDFSFHEHYDITVTIDKNYKVYEKGILVGNWTPIYDQSFVIYYKNSILTAPYKYFKRNQEYMSNCSKTMLGWYVPDKDQRTKNWSCFFAFKTDDSIFHNIKKSPILLQLQSNAETQSNNVSFMQLTTNTDLKRDIKYEHLKGVVKEINNANLLWKADIHDQFRGLNLLEVRTKMGLRKTYKKHFVDNSQSPKININQSTNIPSLGSKQTYMVEQPKQELAVNSDYQDFINSLKQEDNNLEDKKSNQNILNPFMFQAQTEKKNNLLKVQQKLKKKAPQENGREKDSKYVTDYKDVIKYLKTPLDQIPEDKLAKNWDWRNVGGVNYIPRVKNQGRCGSCYTFASITSLEARLRIQTNNKDKTRFSVQFPLACNFYSEGCDGGYPFLVGKFLHEFEIVPEKCFPYTETNSICSNVCDFTKLPKKYRVSNYGYLGGYYGGTSESLILKELRARGPLPGNLRVPYTFSYYKTGIFSEKELKRNTDKLSKRTLADRHLSWEKVEHSVTIVGYGEENGVKYWILMNTWGNNWGENGFFRILRGENDCGVETMGDFLQIEVFDRAK